MCMQLSVAASTGRLLVECISASSRSLGMHLRNFMLDDSCNAKCIFSPLNRHEDSTSGKKASRRAKVSGGNAGERGL